MEGTLLYWSSTPYYWYPFRLQLIDSEGSTSFRRSYLTVPDKEILYGDKPVTHRKMEGSVSPNSSGLVWPWNFDSGIIDKGAYNSTQHRYARWYYQSGINYAWSIGWVCYANRYTGKVWILPEPHCWEAKVEDGKLFRRERWFKTFPYSGTIYDYPDLRPSDFDGSDGGGSWIQTAFKRGEKWIISSYFSQKRISFSLSNPLPYYWIDYVNEKRPGIPAAALSEIIRNTITEYTTYDTNNYANLIEVIDLILDFRNGKIIELVENTQDFFKLVRNTVGDLKGKNLRTLAKRTTKGLASGWLKYRYAYSTTKSDIEQYARAKFGEYLGTLTPERVLRGTIEIPYGTLRVKMRLHDNTAPNFDKFLVSMNQYGLMPGLYNVWDIIPYSFIADWGSHLGDYLQDVDQSIYFRYYQIDELLVSVKQTMHCEDAWGPTDYTWYDRYFLHEMPQWEIYEEEPKTQKVKVFRSLDALSLIVGSL